ncbi:tRNA (adenosine(37)-N6)-dimethylallyltransferase MiaA [Synechococcus sp. MU1643]|uniref:tRNA (adenosine(37)-N6)-dimethylallyltransferase MiaA n=1 Tax=Synechococcus sp. MU1643 TaxID=2508349 RepID=UPI001CF843B0|nr:tRNA (adenosine(37)-N6)-dimethylallyltransferase MiaA [Synechococcus sp. MU1643]MCB4429088.1 tRNA (adenosine(37)-N6)-dimethylallyltransferase MiaA [Synechococcus sp. MU1643]
MNSSHPLVITLLGPTASGKTALALDIAERLNLPVINVDSRQLYREMDIGTAKPTAEQQARVPHHLLDLRTPDQPITLQEFQAIATPCINNALEQQGLALLAGGSGLYLKALTGGLKPPAVAPQPQLRQQLTALGQSICHPLLEAADPQAAAKIAPADAVRTQRALEVLYASGQPMSRQATATPPPWRVLELGLNPANLRQRIQQRTEQLYRDGLVNETRRLSERYGADLPLLQTIGYGEALEVITGSLSTADAVRITSQRTRKFAKRQRTWFRRQHNPHWLHDPSTLTDAMTLIEQHLK